MPQGRLTIAAGKEGACQLKDRTPHQRHGSKGSPPRPTNPMRLGLTAPTRSPAEATADGLMAPPPMAAQNWASATAAESVEAPE